MFSNVLNNVKSSLFSSPIVRQFVAGLTAALTGVSTGCWLGWPSSAIPKLTSNETLLKMNFEETSWMVAIEDVGVLVSPFPSGYLMDFLGRKKTILLCGGILLLSWILTAISLHFSSWYLYAARLLSGLAKGLGFTVLPIYLAEIASVSVRGAVTSIKSLNIWSGILFEFLVGPFVTLTTLTAISAVIPFVFLLIFPFMPDSPYFLVMKGQRNKARSALKWLRGGFSSKSFDKREEDVNSVEKELDEIQICVDEDLKNKGKFTDLISTPSNRHALMIVVVMMIFLKLSGTSCLLFYTSTTLPKSFSVIGPEQAAAIYSGICVLSTVCFAPILDRFGRRPLLMFSALSFGVASGVNAIFYFLNDGATVDVSSFSWVPYASILVSGMVQPGMNIIPFTLQGELFSTHVKAPAAATCTVFNALTSFVVDKLFVTVGLQVGVFANYLFFFVSSLVWTVFVYFFVFETKYKSFFEIQQILKKETK